MWSYTLLHWVRPRTRPYLLLPRCHDHWNDSLTSDINIYIFKKDKIKKKQGDRTAGTWRTSSNQSNVLEGGYPSRGHTWGMKRSFTGASENWVVGLVSPLTSPVTMHILHSLARTLFLTSVMRTLREAPIGLFRAPLSNTKAYSFVALRVYLKLNKTLNSRIFPPAVMVLLLNSHTLHKAGCWTGHNTKHPHHRRKLEWPGRTWKTRLPGIKVTLHSIWYINQCI